MTTWGVVATVKAPTREILTFCAYHLRAGAHRLFIYLDDPEAGVWETLKSHPKIRPVRCDASYWTDRNGKRPGKHQTRQTLNATSCYHHKADVDWLVHIDVDEFLVCEGTISNRLAALPDTVRCARSRPMEALAGDPTLFKGFIPPGRARHEITARLYPVYGDLVKGGFLSHLAGKLFVRTGIADLRFRIHNVMVGDVQNPDEVELDDLPLAHLHAKSWDDWIAHYRYRLQKGSYRQDLGPNRAREQGGVTMHELLKGIEESEGEDGLRAFYDELCVASPDLVARLNSEGLLRRADLQLEAALQAIFPVNI